MRLVTGRHDAVVNRIKNAAIGRWFVVSENRPFGGSSLRPDLVLSKDGSLLIIDVAITFENGPNAFNNIREVKIKKYDCIVKNLKKKYKEIKVVPFVLGALGSWDPRNNLLVSRICSRKYGALMKKLMVSDTLRASSDIFDFHTGTYTYKDPAATTHNSLKSVIVPVIDEIVSAELDVHTSLVNTLDEFDVVHNALSNDKNNSPPSHFNNRNSSGSPVPHPLPSPSAPAAQLRSSSISSYSDDESRLNKFSPINSTCSHPGLELLPNEPANSINSSDEEIVNSMRIKNWSPKFNVTSSDSSPTNSKHSRIPVRIKLANLKSVSYSDHDSPMHHLDSPSPCESRNTNWRPPVTSREVPSESTPPGGSRDTNWRPPTTSHENRKPKSGVPSSEISVGRKFRNDRVHFSTQSSDTSFCKSKLTHSPKKAIPSTSSREHSDIPTIDLRTPCHRRKRSDSRFPSGGTPRKVQRTLLFYNSFKSGAQSSKSKMPRKKASSESDHSNKGDSD